MTSPEVVVTPQANQKVMELMSTRSSGGSDDVTDDTTSMVDIRLSSEDESSDLQGQCLAAPQTPVPTYKQRCDEFKKLFKELSETERLLLDYPCALQRDILLQGRLYLSQNCLCFYSNVFRGTKIALSLKDITSLTREKVARFIPNAILICTNSEKYFFTSFSAREKSYQGVFRIWQNALLDKTLTNVELWHAVKQHYGNELGLSCEEMDSLSAESSMQTSLTRPGGDKVVRMERPPSLRLSGVEPGPLETSTPQEDFPSPISSTNSPNVEESRHILSRRSPAPPLERSVPERSSKHSNHSVDLNANENGVSGPSGSESIEEAVEERVGPSQVEGRLYLNKVFHISASKMFELLFTDSSFFRRFMNERKMTQPTFTPWQKDASGNTKRTLNYVITISNPLIGKFSAATEKQMLYKESKEGQFYLVDAEVYTHDVPYHDYFYTQNRYSIISSSKRKCRLRVYSDVKYKKQPWGLVKSFITKNSWSGIEDYFRQMEAELLEEEAEINQSAGDAGKMGGLRRRRRAYSRTLSEHNKPNKPDHEQHRDGNMGPTEMNSPYRLSVTSIVAVMSVILLILMVLNLGLFFKLWAMEDVAHRMYLSTKQRLRERSEASMPSEYGPLHNPGHRSHEEALLLKTVLQDSISLLEQLRSSLVLLQQNFALDNQTTAP
ncbi:protein Aster-C [Neosynchiropus ocellatus]